MKVNLRYLTAALIFIFSASVIYSLRAASVILPELPRTKLIDEQSQKNDRLEIKTYRYSSQLFKESIKQTYRNKLSSSGWKLQFEKEDSLMFMRGSLGENIVLTFISLADGPAVSYSLKVTTCYRLPILPWTNFKRPQDLSFMPVYSEATQFIYNISFPPMIGVGYLARSEPAKIADFYLENMPEFGWKLVSNKSQSGVYKFSQWLFMLDPFTETFPGLQIQGYEAIIPLLEVRGNTSSFTQGTKSCTITVHKFPGIIEAAKKTIFDASDIEKYGTTLIGIYYFYEKR